MLCHLSAASALKVVFVPKWPFELQPSWLFPGRKQVGLDEEEAMYQSMYLPAESTHPESVVHVSLVNTSWTGGGDVVLEVGTLPHGIKPGCVRVDMENKYWV